MSITTKSYVNNHLSIDKQRSIFGALFDSLNGYEFSLKDKKELNLESDRSYAYGEIAFDGFKEILDVINTSEEIEFMDLGSGLGKALVLASLILPCKRLVGVERLPSLAAKSKDVLNQYCNDMKESYPNVEVPTVSIVQDVFDSISFNTVDVLFACATCFSDNVVDSITSRVHELKVGAYLIILTRQITSNHLECIYKGSHKMGWGLPTVYIYRRKT